MTTTWRVRLSLPLILGLGACVDQRNPTSPIAAAPDYTIADASTGWNPAFYWLPPIVPPFTPSGVFDPARAPIVKICEWASDSCSREVAEYTAAGGTGGETLTVDPVGEHYQVMWRTGNSAVQPLFVDRVYRITVLLDGREAGFADAYLVATRRQAQRFNTPGYVPVVLGSNFKIKFRIEVRTQLLDLYIDHKGDGPIGHELGGDHTYHLTMTDDPSGTFTAVYTDGVTAGVFAGERRFARDNPVVRMVYSDIDYFAVWAGRQNADNSVVGAWFDAEGQTGDFRIVAPDQAVSRSGDDGVRTIPTTYKAAAAGELDGGWVLTFDRLYDGVYVPEAGGRSTLAFSATGATTLSGVYTDGSSGAFAGELHTARNTSVITLLFSNTDYYAAFAGAMIDPYHIVGVYFDAEGYSGDFVLTRRYREDFGGNSIPSGWQARGGSWWMSDGALTGSFSEVGVDAQLTRTNLAGTPRRLRARILNTPGAPQGAAGVAFNWVSSTEYYAVELRTNNPTLSADIVSLGPGGTQILASCPAGLSSTDTWFVLELEDTPAGLVGQLLDEEGVPTSCSMLVPGAHVTNLEFGVVVYSGGGLVQVDWIEADTN